MGETLVRLDHVSKRFLLDRATDRSLMEIFVRPFRRAREREYFWPLQNITFELERGESLGIIGENGTGKSTILKLIAHILEPTSGTVSVFGRVSALLELGASFHPELTGRENIFLAASIAGVQRADVSPHLDEIIDFADIGPYIDVPVKHYSSGMYVRLGFAVAIHLRPDILLVDEVLAVGDEAFQHKCRQAIRAMQREGVSIILVSHGMEQVAETCNVALWLHEGHLRSIGEAREVIDDYLASSSADEQSAHVARWARALPADQNAAGASKEPIRHYERGAPAPDARRWGDMAVVVRDACLLGGDGRPTVTFQPHNTMSIRFSYQVRALPDKPLAFGIAIYRSDQVWVYGTNTSIEGMPFAPRSMPEAGIMTVDLPVLQLLQGEYSLDVAIHSQDGEITHDYVRDAVRFYVKNPRGDSGLFRPEVHWSLRALEERVAR